MAIWRPFYVVCPTCGHRNRPHRSPSEGIRMALMGQLPPCKGCGKELRPELPDRPLVLKLRKELEAQGTQPCYLSRGCAERYIARLPTKVFSPPAGG
jgi:hypothetical protein